MEPRPDVGDSGIPRPAGIIPDVDRGLDLMSFLCPGSDIAQLWVLPGDPPSKSRPRFAKGRTYQTATDRAAEEATGWALKAQWKREAFGGNVALGCVFFRRTRHRIDVDNMLKHICDAATGILWGDDSQVTALAGFAELDAENPRTIVVIGEHTSTMTRGRAAARMCAQCGGPITDPKRHASPRTRFCSRACAVASRERSLADLVPCPTCEEPFRRKTTSQKFCSISCVPRKGVPKPWQAKPPRPCADCGAPVSKPGYVRCRRCWLMSRIGVTP